eukprot:761535-Rhodomonas_salina.3
MTAHSSAVALGLLWLISSTASTTENIGEITPQLTGGWQEWGVQQGVGALQRLTLKKGSEPWESSVEKVKLNQDAGDHGECMMANIQTDQEVIRAKATEPGGEKEENRENVGQKGLRQWNTEAEVEEREKEEQVAANRERRLLRNTIKTRAARGTRKAW